MDRQLQATLRQTIGLARPTGASAYGDPTYADATTVAARVETMIKQVRRSDGQFATSTHWINTGTVAVGAADRIWLPGDDTGDATKARLPLSVEGIPDEKGALDHYEVVV